MAAESDGIESDDDDSKVVAVESNEADDDDVHSMVSFSAVPSRDWLCSSYLPVSLVNHLDFVLVHQLF